ncbi:MAG TPA: hypothetical protein VFU81_08010 [Thermomicrobiales bacterium]|nr:hypothetical protein [Thermomicrobiales bacterium]
MRRLSWRSTHTPAQHDLPALHGIAHAPQLAGSPAAPSRSFLPLSHGVPTFLRLAD